MGFPFLADTFFWGLFWQKWLFFATYFEEQFKPQILLGYHKKTHECISEMPTLPHFHSFSMFNAQKM